MPESPAKSSFETSAQSWSEERERLLQSQVHELGLKIEGTRLEPLVQRLYDELEAAGIDLRPHVFLSDEWGCPEGVPAIGVPFYLGDEKLMRLERELLDEIEAESDADILRYLRHEAGHAFNYAYRLYESEAWHGLFGPYSRPYREDYEPNPFSRNFVRHISGWYAQKHPDEDFAETFAVWLTPTLDWRADYREWACYAKLLYVDRIVHELGRMPPRVSAAYVPSDDELRYSVAEHHRRFGHQPVQVPAYFDGDLRELFETAPAPHDRTEWESAGSFIKRQRAGLVRNIGYWTGLNEHIVRSLLDHFVERCNALSLWLRTGAASETLGELTTYATTLCMNRLYKGDFISK